MGCAMTFERADRALEDPNAQLETTLIDEFLRTRGLDRDKLHDLPEAQATQLRKEASAYATARLTALDISLSTSARSDREPASVVRRLMRATSCVLTGLILSAALLATTPGCTSPPEPPAQDQRVPQSTLPAQYDTQTVTVVLPVGDTQAGRQAFRDLKCTLCHRVRGETTFPAPVSGTQGPDLDRTLAVRPAADVAEAIVVPSHSMSVKTSDEVKKRLEGMLSPMPDFSCTITVRQLADLLAYLRSLEAAK
jgi:mono/diheme cytochrome c family protein